MRKNFDASVRVKNTHTQKIKINRVGATDLKIDETTKRKNGKTDGRKSVFYIFILFRIIITESGMAWQRAPDVINSVESKNHSQFLI